MTTKAIILNPKTSASVIEGFFFDTSLYVEKPFNEVSFLTNKTKIDGYCIHCKKERTFTIEHQIHAFGQNFREIFFSTPGRRAQVYKLHCTRETSHSYVYIIEQNNKKDKGFELKKIGQIPTVADIAFANFSDIKNKLANLVDPEAWKELSKAQGLYSHGLGLPPFVYLRRIVERLVWKTFDAEKSNNDWSEEDFLRLRIKERIEFLKDFLPSRLVEYKNIYSILSKGIHELTEEQCLKAYPKLEKAIVLMVRDEIRKDQEKKEQLELKKFIDDPDLE